MAATLTERVRDILATQPDIREVREVRMFGGMSFMVDGRMAVAAGRDESLLVRTDPDDYEALIERGAVPAQMGKSRPMGRGWLMVPAPALTGRQQLSSWIRVGIESRQRAH